MMGACSSSFEQFMCKIFLVINELCYNEIDSKNEGKQEKNRTSVSIRHKTN